MLIKTKRSQIKESTLSPVYIKCGPFRLDESVLFSGLPIVRLSLPQPVSFASC